MPASSNGDLTCASRAPARRCWRSTAANYALDPEVTRDRRRQRRAEPRRRHGRRARRAAPRRRPRSSSRRRCSTRCAPPRPAAGSTSVSDARYRFERGVDPEFIAPGPGDRDAADPRSLRRRGVGDRQSPAPCRNGGARYPLRARPRRQRWAGSTSRVAESAPNPRSARLRGRRAKGATCRSTPPSWRGDIVGEADLVEEVLRVKGYRRDPAGAARRATTRAAAAGARRRRSAAPSWCAARLAARGLIEAVTFSFIAAASGRACSAAAQPALQLVNPIAADLDVMRPSVLPNLIDAARRNADRGFPDLALFELGPLYRDDAPEGQMTVAGGIRAGRSAPRDWRARPPAPDFFAAKADALAALAAAGAPVDNVQVQRRSAGLVSSRPRRHVAAGSDGARPFWRAAPRHPRRLRRQGSGRRVRGVPRRGAPPRAQGGPRAPAAQALACSSRSSATSPSSSTAPCPPRRCCAPPAGSTASWSPRSACSMSMKAPGLPEGKKSLAIAVTLQPQEAHPDRRRDRSLLAKAGRGGREGDGRRAAGLD